MHQVNIAYWKSPIGDLILGSFEGKLCLLDFRHRRLRPTVDKRIKKGLFADYVEQDDPLLSRTRRQLGEYLEGRRTEFDIPLQMVGSEFQKRVWKALLNVPYGTTSTYLELARSLHKENAVRAVAQANGANAIGVIIPCHRIIGSHGELTGYGGGVALKRHLLKLESTQRQPTLF